VDFPVKQTVSDFMQEEVYDRIFDPTSYIGIHRSLYGTELTTCLEFTFIVQVAFDSQVALLDACQKLHVYLFPPIETFVDKMKSYKRKDRLLTALFYFGLFAIVALTMLSTAMLCMLKEPEARVAVFMLIITAIVFSYYMLRYAYHIRQAEINKMLIEPSPKIKKLKKSEMDKLVKQFKIMFKAKDQTDQAIQESQIDGSKERVTPNYVYDFQVHGCEPSTKPTGNSLIGMGCRLRTAGTYFDDENPGSTLLATAFHVMYGGSKPGEDDGRKNVAKSYLGGQSIQLFNAAAKTTTVVNGSVVKSRGSLYNWDPTESSVVFASKELDVVLIKVPDKLWSLLQVKPSKIVHLKPGNQVSAHFSINLEHYTSRCSSRLRSLSTTEKKLLRNNHIGTAASIAYFASTPNTGGASGGKITQGEKGTIGAMITGSLILNGHHANVATNLSIFLKAADPFTRKARPPPSAGSAVLESYTTYQAIVDDMKEAYNIEEAVRAFVKSNQRFDAVKFMDVYHQTFMHEVNQVYMDMFAHQPDPSWEGRARVYDKATEEVEEAAKYMDEVDYARALNNEFDDFGASLANYESKTSLVSPQESLALQPYVIHDECKRFVLVPDKTSVVLESTIEPQLDVLLDTASDFEDRDIDSKYPVDEEENKAEALDDFPSIPRLVSSSSDDDSEFHPGDEQAFNENNYPFNSVNWQMQFIADSRERLRQEYETQFEARMQAFLAAQSPRVPAKTLKPTPVSRAPIERGFRGAVPSIRRSRHAPPLPLTEPSAQLESQAETKEEPRTIIKGLVEYQQYLFEKCKPIGHPDQPDSLRHLGRAFITFPPTKGKQPLDEKFEKLMSTLEKYNQAKRGAKAVLTSLQIMGKKRAVNKTDAPAIPEADLERASKTLLKLYPEARGPTILLQLKRIADYEALTNQGPRHGDENVNRPENKADRAIQESRIKLTHNISSALKEFVETEDEDSVTELIRDACLSSVKGSATSGAPYIMEYSNNAEFLKARGDEIVEKIVDRLIYLIQHKVPPRGSRESKLRARDTGLDNTNLRDLVRVFVKGEPHSNSKVAEGRMRLICGVSLIDAVVAHILFAGTNKAEIKQWWKIPSKAGMGMDTAEQNKRTVEYVHKLAKGGKVLATDMKYWDWSFSRQMHDFNMKFRLEKTTFSGDLKSVSLQKQIYESMVTSWYHGYVNCVLVTPDGTLIGLPLHLLGIMLSGSKLTSSDNSRARVMLAICAGALRAMANGDDAIEDANDPVARLAYYKKYGWESTSDAGPNLDGIMPWTNFELNSHDFVTYRHPDSGKYYSVANRQNVAKSAYKLLTRPTILSEETLDAIGGSIEGAICTADYPETFDQLLDCIKEKWCQPDSEDPLVGKLQEILSDSTQFRRPEPLALRLVDFKL